MSLITEITKGLDALSEVVQRHERRDGVRGEEAQEVVVHVVLVEPPVPRQRHAQLRHARLDAVVAAVQRQVAPDARVLHPLQPCRQGAADGEPTTAEHHLVREVDVLQVAL